MDLLKEGSEKWLTKLVLPCNDIKAIQSKGLLALYIFSTPRATNNRSAQNSMYSHIKVEFIPINSTGSASHTKYFSIFTASPIISWIRSCDSLFTKWSLYSKHAKSQCNPSSREINFSFLLLVFVWWERGKRVYLLRSKNTSQASTRASLTRKLHRMIQRKRCPRTRRKQSPSQQTMHYRRLSIGGTTLLSLLQIRYFRGHWTTCFFLLCFSHICR